MKRKLIDKIIYNTTKKPQHYAEVKNPPLTPLEKLFHPQDARQLQYNKWSKAKQIYSGSYLPYRSEELLKQGWIEVNQGKSKEPANKEFKRKSTGQHVLRHNKRILKNGLIEKTHYHWKNPDANNLGKKINKIIIILIFMVMFAPVKVLNLISNPTKQGERKNNDKRSFYV